MFAIIDRRGRTVGFGGRIIDQGEPKYLNSPETPIFHKSNEVYGLYQVLQSKQKLEHILIVEGYMDVVGLAQFGIQYAVATLGTALTPEHLQQLFRHCNKLIFCFDGDKAGRKAAWRSLEISLDAIKDGRQLQFLFLPDGEDPDSLIRQEGHQQFEQRVKNAVPLSRYMQSHLEQQCDMSSVDGRSQLASLAKPLIAKIADPVYRDLLNQQFKKATGTVQNLSTTPTHSMQQSSISSRYYEGNRPGFGSKQYQTTFSSRKNQSGKNVFNKRQTVKPMSLMRKTIAYLLQHPNYGLHVEDWQWLQVIEDAGAKLLAELLEMVKKTPEITTATLIEHYRGTPTYTHLTTLVNWHYEIPHDDNLKEFQLAMLKLMENTKKVEMQRLLDESKVRPLTTKEKQTIQKILLETNKSTPK